MVDNRDGTSHVTLLFDVRQLHGARRRRGRRRARRVALHRRVGGRDGRALLRARGRGLNGGEAGKLATLTCRRSTATATCAPRAPRRRRRRRTLQRAAAADQAGATARPRGQVDAPAAAAADGRGARARGAGAVRGRVRALGNGLYGAEYAVSESGGYDLRVSHLGVALRGSPFRISVCPSATHVPSCMRLFVAQHDEPLPQTTAGAMTSFDIVARDEHRNARGVGGDWFTATLHGPETVHAEVVDRGDGTYTVRYCPRRSGDYLLPSQRTRCTLRARASRSPSRQGRRSRRRAQPRRRSAGGRGGRGAELHAGGARRALQPARRRRRSVRRLHRWPAPRPRGRARRRRPAGPASRWPQ